MKHDCGEEMSYCGCEDDGVPIYYCPNCRVSECIEPSHETLVDWMKVVYGNR